MIIRIVIILLGCFLTYYVHAQLDSNKTFELSKGKWKLPIDHLNKISLPNNGNLGLTISCTFSNSIIFISNQPSEVYSVADGKVAAVFLLFNLF